MEDDPARRLQSGRLLWCPWVRFFRFSLGSPLMLTALHDSMKSFDNRMASAVDNSGTKGWLVAILELGAWVCRIGP